MTLRCKPGDLAIVVGVRRTPEALGLLVNVVRRIHTGERMGNGRTLRASDPSAPMWEVTPASGGLMPSRRTDPIEMIEMVSHAAVWDSHLRPIRDPEGEDETLTWAGKPETLQA